MAYYGNTTYETTTTVSQQSGVNPNLTVTISGNQWYTNQQYQIYANLTVNCVPGYMINFNPQIVVEYESPSSTYSQTLTPSPVSQMCSVASTYKVSTYVNWTPSDNTNISIYALFNGMSSSNTIDGYGIAPVSFTNMNITPTSITPNGQITFTGELVYYLNGWNPLSTQPVEVNLYDVNHNLITSNTVYTQSSGVFAGEILAPMTPGVYTLEFIYNGQLPGTASLGIGGSIGGFSGVRYVKTLNISLPNLLGLPSISTIEKYAIVGSVALLLGLAFGYAIGKK